MLSAPVELRISLRKELQELFVASMWPFGWCQECWQPILAVLGSSSGRFRCLELSGHCLEGYSWCQALRSCVRHPKGLFCRSVEELSLDFQLDAASEAWFELVRAEFYNKCRNT